MLAPSPRSCISQYSSGGTPTQGVYQLAATLGSAVNYTRCIPYDVSADDLASMLAELPLVQQRGGVTGEVLLVNCVCACVRLFTYVGYV